MPTYETPGPITVRVQLSSADVTIETADTTQTDVELIPLRDDDATRQAIQEIAVGMRDRPGGGQLVYVEEPKRPRFGISFRGPKFAVRVRCPHSADFECSSGSSDVRAIGRLGDVSIKTASGDTIVDEVAGSLAVNSASGDITVELVGGGATVNTASGDVSIGTAAGPLRANLVSGDLNVGRAHSDLVATSVSGDQELEAVSGGDVRVNSVSGDVRVGVVPGIRLWIDASSMSGSTTSELQVGDLPPGPADGPVVQLRAKSVSGDIEIVRAVQVSP